MKNKGHDVSEVLDVTQLGISIKQIAEEDECDVNSTSRAVQVLLHAIDFVLKDELTYQQFYDELDSSILEVIDHALYSMNKFVTNKSKLPQDGAQVFSYRG